MLKASYVQVPGFTVSAARDETGRGFVQLDSALLPSLRLTADEAEKHSADVAVMAESARAFDETAGAFVEGVTTLVFTGEGDVEYQEASS
jgi:hypothetical protein